jgi:hypothetical protein
MQIAGFICNTICLHFPRNRGPCTLTKEAREGWPLLTVETEAYGDSGSIHMKGVLPWLFFFARHTSTRIFFVLP